ncbi:MAG: hypothetical protein MZV64_57520 [Ignavibacteriales bacterium]|nr:hypothetical protein [Ignavibacteriales bacterium]
MDKASENATSQEIIDQVAKCPSWCIKHKRKSMIEIKQIDSGTKGYFAAFDGENEAGRMSYTFAGETRNDTGSYRSK